MRELDWDAGKRSRSRPGCRERCVGGGGGTVHPRLSLRTGLCLHPHREDAERVIRPFTLKPDPGARPACANMLRRVHESLQGRPEVGPLPTPRRCLGIFRCFRVHRCELRFHSVLTDRRDQLPNRTRVQKLSTARTTCLVRSFASHPLHADAQAGTGLSAGFSDPPRGATVREHM